MVTQEQRKRQLAREKFLRQQQRRTASGAELLALTYEVAHLDADLRWIDESERRLNAGGDVGRMDAS